MKVITIAGRLGRDAQTRDVGQDGVTSFSVAVDERGRDGAKNTVWFDCSLWGRRGAALEQYLTKGSAVCVSGELGLREYQGRDGAPRTSLTVRVSEITLMGGREGGREGGRDGRDGGRSNGGDRRDDRQDSYDYGGGDFGDGDIPFITCDLADSCARTRSKIAKAFRW